MNKINAHTASFCSGIGANTHQTFQYLTELTLQDLYQSHVLITH